MASDFSLHVVLHQPEIPPNTGNIGRTCVAIGAKMWLVKPLGFSMDEKQVRRAGLDYWHHVQWEAVEHWEALSPQRNPARTWYFTKHAQRLYTDVRFERGDWMVFGSETHGLPRSILDQAGDQALLIPMLPPVRSLNLSNSVAIVVYEALRQWREAGS